MNPDISFLLEASDLGATAFSVLRSTASFDHGELIPVSVTHTASGIILPGGFSYTDQQTGEDKQGSGITVYTRFPMTAGSNDGEAVTLADEIHYGDHSWRVMEVLNHSDRGFCVAKAIKET